MTTQKVKPIRFEPRWRAAHPDFRQTIEALIAEIELGETRARRRRAHADGIFRLAAEAVVCNLTAISLVAPDRQLAVPLANRASQIEPIYGRPARKIVEAMVRLKLIRKTKGYPYLGPTTIAATARFKKRFPPMFGWSALSLADSKGPIVLSTKEDAEESGTQKVQHQHRLSKETRTWLRAAEKQMHEINALLATAPINAQGRSAYVDEHSGGPLGRLLTPHHRSLRRTFNGRYDHGGRLFGGFWQNMQRPDRFRYIRIQNERIAIVDYSQLFLRLAYAEAKVEPPKGDLYEVFPQDRALPNWNRLRAARKKLLNALLFRETPLKQWPGGSVGERKAIREAFPDGIKPTEAISNIKRKHSAIAPWFENGHGLRLMRRESDLIAAVTLALFKRGIVALPIHDAVVVASSKARVAKRVMEAEAARMTGVRIPAEIQTAAR